MKEQLLNFVEKPKEKKLDTDTADFHSIEKFKNYKHLREDIKPIFACIGKTKEHENQSKTLCRIFNNQSVKNVENINYSENPYSLEEKNIKNAGWRTYVISPIDSFDKFSRKYLDCTGLIVAGKDKATNENISFITHQDPTKFLDDKKEIFIKNLEEHLDEIKKRSAEKTIDVVIVGGNFLNKEDYNENYIQSIKLLEQEIFKKFGFYPVVAIGPKTTGGLDTIFYDNKNRRVFIGRNSGETSFTPGYISKDLEKNTKNWEF